MIDRTTPPRFQAISTIALPDAQKHILKNGLSLIGINTGLQPAVKIELIFNAGSKQEKKKGVASLVSKMLLGGTSNANATQLAERFSQYGGFTEVSYNAEQLFFTVYGLAQHLHRFLPLIVEVLTDATMPESKLATQKQIMAQKLQVNLEKTSFLAGQEYKKQLFGNNHALGKSTSLEDIANITRADALSFYEDEIKNQPFTIFLSGQYSEENIEQVDNHLGGLSLNEEKIKVEIQEPARATGSFLIEKEGSVQSTIRLGRMLFPRSHHDYLPFLVMNTVFGGYFGSRLMKNIREDKGFTYGISSSITPSKSLGYFLIGTDVKREFTQQTIDEIGKEIQLLQKELVSATELTTVKNYMIGSVAGSINNPFDIADKHKMLLREHLTTEYYADYVKKINSITAMDVQRMAQEYLNLEDMIEVEVGGK